MAFTVTSEISDNVAKIVLSGELDSASSRVFQQEIEKFSTTNPKYIVLFVKDLNFMASAGLRVLIFAKQKLGTEVNIYLVNPQEQILNTLKMTGFHHSVHIVDKYPV